MDQVITIIAALTLIYLFVTLIEFIFGFNSIKNLSEQNSCDSAQLPSVSIIFGALNEEADINAAVMSFLNIDYPQLEIIAINDRSHDKTPEILNKLQEQHPQLKVHHITTLPNNWIGKNHALQYGSQHATGEWLLFTDADVLMNPDTVTKAISYARENNIDHITINEHHLRNTFGLKILLLANYITYSMFLKPWRIRYQWSNKSLGHGAFNLVKKSVYEKCGAHQAIALECLDDLKLGELIKKNGFRQDTVDGSDYVQREWYLSLPDMIQGFEKNAFAFLDYSLLKLSVHTLFAILFFIGPIIFVCLYAGLSRWLNLMNISLMLIISAYVCHHFRLKMRYAIFYPPAIMLLLYSMWNSAFAIYRDQGVVWRGTHYPLDKLKSIK